MGDHISKTMACIKKPYKTYPPNLPCMHEFKHAVEKWKGRIPSYLGNEGLYQKTVKGVPPIIYHAESNYALKKWKGRLPSYLGNEGSYQKTVKGIPSLIYHAESKYALEKWKGCPEHSRTF